MFLDCNLEFVDMRRIGPSAGHDFVWINYMGDSLGRDLFYHTAQTMSRYMYEKTWLDDIADHDPLLGDRSKSIPVQIHSYC